MTPLATILSKVSKPPPGAAIVSLSTFCHTIVAPAIGNPGDELIPVTPPPSAYSLKPESFLHCFSNAGIHV